MLHRPSIELSYYFGVSSIAFVRCPLKLSAPGQWYGIADCRDDFLNGLTPCGDSLTLFAKPFVPS